MVQSIQMINKIKQNKYISAGAAFTSVLAMWLFYYLGTKAPAHIEPFIFGVGVILLLSTLLPAIYVKLYEHGDLSDLGIHARRIKLLKILKSIASKITSKLLPTSQSNDRKC